ncbi:TMEM175 family protein [Phycicoccus avicenniae]|uniref:TMEM175 family protein n=1 Tax=Phycicoccus avicenniae TaxID=2828860 RepID=UPI003D2A5B83
MEQRRGGEPEDGPGPPTFVAERTTAFLDAVVAIAMTLLILPLMESVGDVAESGASAGEWFGEHDQQLVSFVLSFVLIAMFWISHHRLYASVQRVTVPLLCISMAWLLTIVWLPVATAMSGRFSDGDGLVKAVYIGSMIAICLMTLVTRAYLARQPELHDSSQTLLRRGMAVDIAQALLFTLALVLAVTVRSLGYSALFIMVLVGPLQGAVGRMLGVPRGP